MKFGGTSVADAAAISRAVSIVIKSRDEAGTPPVVIVSAMGGVTDRLLALARAAELRAEAHISVDALWDRHVTALRALVPAPVAASVESQMQLHFDDLRALLGSAAILRSAAPAALDAIASTGELASSRIFAAALDAAGVPASWVDGRTVVVTDNSSMSATPLHPDTRQAAQLNLAPELAAGRVPVLGGFIGATTAGVTTTLGRGGSDYSASIVGVAIGASEIHIWTDVDGMLTADPRAIANARVVPFLSFGEASELAYFGAKVLHPATILPAVSHGIPVRILNSHRPSAPGTLITESRSPDGHPLAAVACKRHITMVEIVSTRMLMTYGFLRRVFEVFEHQQTSVDVVTTSEVSVSVTVDDDVRLTEIVNALREFAEVNVERDMAILSAVGDNLCLDSRIAAHVIGALEEFPVRMVSQAASRRNVTIVLRDADVMAAMSQLHAVFFETKELGARG